MHQSGRFVDHVEQAVVAPRGNPLHLVIDRVQRRLAQGLRRVAVGRDDRLAVHPHEPLRRRQEDDGVVAAPAVRVAVLVRLVVPEPAAIAQRLDDGRIGLEHLLAREQLHVVGEAAVRADRRVDLEAVLHAGEVVVRAMTGCGVDGARALFERDVVRQHGQRRAVVERMRELQSIELIAADERHRLADLALGGPGDLRRQLLRHDHETSVVRIEPVDEVRMECHREVRRDRPGRRRPDEN